MKKFYLIFSILVFANFSYASDEIAFTLRGFVMDGPKSQNPTKDFNFLTHENYFTQLHNSKGFDTLITGELQKTKVLIELWKRDGKRGSQLFLDHRNLRKSILNKKKNVKLTRVCDSLYPDLTLFDFMDSEYELSFKIPRSFKAQDEQEEEEEIVFNCNKDFSLDNGVYFLVVRFLQDQNGSQPDSLGKDDPGTIIQAYDYEFFTKRETKEDGTVITIVDNEADYRPSNRLTNLNRVLDKKVWKSEYESDKKQLSLNVIFPNLKKYLKTVPKKPEPGIIRLDQYNKNYVRDNEFVVWTGVTQHGDKLNKFVIRNGDILLRAGEDSQIALGLAPPPKNFDNDPLMGNLSWNNFPISIEELFSQLDPEAKHDDTDEENESGKKISGNVFSGIESLLKKLKQLDNVAQISVALYKATLDFLISKGEDVPDNVEDSYKSLIDKEIRSSIVEEMELTAEEYKQRYAAGEENIFEAEDEEGNPYYYASVTTTFASELVPEGVIGFEDLFTYKAEFIKYGLRQTPPNIRIDTTEKVALTEDEFNKRFAAGEKNIFSDVDNMGNKQFFTRDPFCRDGLKETVNAFPTKYKSDGTPASWGKIVHHNCMPYANENDLKGLIASKGKYRGGIPNVNPFHIPINMEDKIDQAVLYYPGTIFLTHVGMAVIEYNKNGEKELWVYDAYPNKDGFGGIRRTTWAEFFGATNDPITGKLAVHATAGGVFRVPGKDVQGRLYGVEAANQAQLFYRTWKHREDATELAKIKKEDVKRWIDQFSDYEGSDWYVDKLAEFEAEELYPLVEDPFDYGFDWTTSWRMACSEFAYRSYAKTGINIIPNLTILRMPLEGVHKLGWEVVEKFAQASPQSIMLSPRVARVADFLSHTDPGAIRYENPLNKFSHEEKAELIANFMDNLLADHKEKPVDISKIDSGNENKRGSKVLVDFNTLRLNGQPVFSLYEVPADSIN